MIQPAGLGGSPPVGQWIVAATKASWTASSAISMSPKMRTRTDTARPYSLPKTHSISDRRTAGTPNSVPGLFLEWSDLDRQAAGHRGLAPPSQGGVEVARADDPETADVLLALDERTIGHEEITVLHAEHRRRACRMEPPGKDPCAGSLDLFVEQIDVAHRGFEDLGR